MMMMIVMMIIIMMMMMMIVMMIMMIVMIMMMIMMIMMLMVITMMTVVFTFDKSHKLLRTPLFPTLFSSYGDDDDVYLNKLQRKVLQNLWSEYMNNVDQPIYYK
jgi:hypothetical protein